MYTDNMLKDNSFKNKVVLITGGGTGLGKSLAYLSSGYLAAKKKNISLVISTHTKHLQTQLLIASLRAPIVS